MTIVYYKDNGEIQGVYSGDLQHINTLYGERARFFKQILDEICIPDDKIVIDNYSMFKINTKTKQLESIINKYPTASA